MEEEEVAVFAVTDYRVAFFMSRSPDVMDKRIRISDPVWWDQAKPSAKAYWLRFMRLAAERHSGSIWQPTRRTMAPSIAGSNEDTAFDCRALMAPRSFFGRSS